jgi:NADH-quinone oxidoreductase subunit A
LVNPVAEGYLPVLILAGVSLLLIFMTLLLSSLLAPRNPYGRKLTTYESGEVPKGTGRGPIEVQYYPYILLFLVLDVEILFLVPFAIMFLDLGLAGVIKMVIFVGLLVHGWLYAWKKGALQWVR